MPGAPFLRGPGYTSSDERAKSVQRTVWGDLTEEQTYALYCATLGYSNLPAWDDLPQGLPAGYVETETRRMVAAVRDQIPVYPGIDVDVPVGRGMAEDYHRSTPEDVYAAVRAAFAGGATCIVISRKYSEARLENLAAVGAAVRSLAAGAPAAGRDPAAG